MNKEINMRWASELQINGRCISTNEPTYFIADIAANHDGELSRAKDLIWKAKEAGADCAKFQHFVANKIVSNYGFKGEWAAVSHQSTWSKSVSEIYDQYHTKREWTNELFEECEKAEIDFMTTPYDIEAIQLLDKYLTAYKIGSGDITYKDILLEIANKKKPVFLATGAADIDATLAAVKLILEKNPHVCVMQCNTNYTGSLENFRYVNLNVLKTFSTLWPNMVLGLSDHTPGHTAVLGAIALGARVIEKHFTDDNSREGPDHAFALNPTTWSEMVVASRELELALGDGIKRVETNEEKTIVIQRRALRCSRDLCIGTKLSKGDLEALRPCPEGALTPMIQDQVIGRTLKVNLKKGEHITWDCLVSQ
jgi:sialic acid synthase SpsE